MISMMKHLDLKIFFKIRLQLWDVSRKKEPKEIQSSSVLHLQKEGPLVDLPLLF